jgi:hypothetical protein
MSDHEPPDWIKRELDRRLADDEANPDDGFSLDEVMAEADEVVRHVQAGRKSDRD